MTFDEAVEICRPVLNICQGNAAMTDAEAMEAAERKIDDLIEAWRSSEEGGIDAGYKFDEYRRQRTELIAIVATVLKLEAA